MKTGQSTVVLSIRKQWCKEILEGRKTLELRKSAPKAARWPITVLLYETKADGGAGAIVGQFTCHGLVTCKGLYSTMARRSLVAACEIAKYAADGKVYGWAVSQPQQYDEPVQLEAIGITRAPQSWRYLRPAERMEANGI